MASRMLAAKFLQPTSAPAMLLRAASTGAMNPHLAEKLEKIGNRDVVGFGWNGEPVYYDRPDFPMPAVRFKENTPDVLVSLTFNRFVYIIFLATNQIMTNELYCRLSDKRRKKTGRSFQSKKRKPSIVQHSVRHSLR